MRYYIILGVFILGGLYTTSVGAQANAGLETFRFVSTVTTPASVVVPTVVELPLRDTRYEYPFFAVQEKDTKAVIANYYRAASSQNTIPVSVSVESKRLTALSDGQYNSHHEFPLLNQEGSSVVLTMSADTPVESSALIFSLAPHVTLPTSVSITAVIDGQERIVLSKYRPTGTKVMFPTTRASLWQIELSYSQPLRLLELSLEQSSLDTTFSHALRWLAQPGVIYEIYNDPDRAVRVTGQEAGNLRSNEGVRVLVEAATEKNPLYQISDVDEDNVPDILDNCVAVYNPDQIDIDANNRGDVCDDFDKDDVINTMDNCQNIPNRNQSDEDGDGIGDVCDDEESRITEKYLWIPWVGMGLAALVILSLFVLVARHKPEDVLDTASTEVPPQE